MTQDQPENERDELDLESVEVRDLDVDAGAADEVHGGVCAGPQHAIVQTKTL